MEDDIWNFDEIGFQIGVGRDQWIITRDFSSQKPHIGMNTNREYVTVVEAINSKGNTCPPLIIMAGKCILKGWFEYTKIEQGYHIGVTESAYMTDQMAYQWIQTFYQSTKKYRKGRYTLLICDGYGSHLTFEFVQFCKKNNIIIFFLPPHTSHFLQPLDVVMPINTGILRLWQMQHICKAIGERLWGVSLYTYIMARCLQLAVE